MTPEVKNRIFKQINRFPRIKHLYSFLFSRKRKTIVKNTLLKLSAIQKLTDEGKQKVNDECLYNYLKQTIPETPYYSQYKILLNNKENILSNFNCLPILTKKQIQKNSTLLINKLTKKSLVKRTTGGSTGQPLEFWTDKYSTEIDNAHHWHLYKLMGYTKNDIIISFGGMSIPKTDIDKNRYWLEDKNDNVFGDFKFSANHLNESTFEFYIKKIKEINPSIIRSYPSTMLILTDLMMEHKTEFDFKLKGINLSSEVCTLSQKTFLENYWNTKITNEYGNKELTVFCYSSPGGNSLKSSPIYGYTEVLDYKDNPVKLGEVGRIVTTGFLNYGMPFIRYDTGDLGILTKRNGGVVEFKEITGRTQDYIVNKLKEKIRTVSIYSDKMESILKIKSWQLIQDTPGILKIYVIKGNKFTEADEINIRNHSYLTEFEIDFYYVNELQRTKAGKLPFVIQKIIA